jgi:hypothetical protein
MNIAVGQHYTHKRLHHVWRVAAVTFDDGKVHVTLQETTGASTMKVTPDNLEAHWERRDGQTPEVVVMARGMQSYSVYCGCGETGTCQTSFGYLLCPGCGTVWRVPNKLRLVAASEYEATSERSGEIDLDKVPPSLQVPP